ncbi:MAG: type II toxin-antitoxin system antitoxin SocA domain-containing protein [bacterium]
MDNMLAKFIRQQRLKQGLTQEYMASELGISRPTYIQIERGAREMTVSEAKVLAAVFSIPFGDFLQGRAPLHKVTLEKSKRKSEKSSLHIRVTEKNLAKFKQVLLYILEKVGSKPNVGETVLHKILYFIDFDYYEKYEENLMGATYIKNLHGPTSVELGSILNDMQDRKQIERVKSSYFKYEQKKYLPVKRANLSLLSARELEHIDEVLARLADKNAKEIENYSHEDIPWKAAGDGERLSYESVFYRDEKYSVRNYEDEL